MSEAIQKYSKLEQKAKLLKTGYKQLAAGKTTHEEFEQLIKQIKFTADEWDELLSLDGDYILLSDEIIDSVDCFSVSSTRLVPVK